MAMVLFGELKNLAIISPLAFPSMIPVLQQRTNPDTHIADINNTDIACFNEFKVEHFN
jgi:hypothetical protein